MKNIKNFMGLDGFVWWIGVVENRADPLMLGRAQVRMFGWHTDDKTLIPTADLPWAHSITPLNNPAPVSPREGEWVLGFFMDGENAQYPVMMGIIPGIPEEVIPPTKGFSDPRLQPQLSGAPRPPEATKYPTDGTGIQVTEAPAAQRYPYTLNQPMTPNLARNENLEGSIIQKRKDNRALGVETATGETWDEPETKYAAKYPYNDALVSESGHVIEVDDTFGHERLHRAHRTGTFEEMYPDGSKVTKVVKDNYHVTMGNDFVYIMGVCNITVQGKAKLYVKSDYDVKVDGNMNYTVKGNLNTTVQGNIQTNVDGTHKTEAGGNLEVKAPRIDLNP